MRTVQASAVEKKRRLPRLLGFIGRVTGITCLMLMSLAVPAYAHGDMVGPDELGPPMVIAGALGIISYWLVLLWPRSRSDDDDDEAGGETRRTMGSGPPMSVGPQSARSVKTARLIRVK